MRAAALLVLLALAAVSTAYAGYVWPEGIDVVTSAKAELENRMKDRCTMIGVAAKASADGSTMATHTNDCADCDFRVALVKGKVHSNKERRAIAPARFQYPRYIGLDRGQTYVPERVIDTEVWPWKPTQPLAHIEEVERTYNYLDGSYGLINENQVGFGESTCSGKLVNIPKHDGGNATFDLSELTRVALARARTAREAIQIMGDLAYHHGFYGTEWKGGGMYGEAGEALMVTDPQEAWVFHILPDGTDNSAVWAAQRIPDEHVAVCANEFIIGEIDLKDPKNFMFSDNMIDIAVKHKFWSPDSGKPFNFRLAFSQPEFHVHHSYSDRRNWRVFDLVAPSLKLPQNSSLDTLPFSVKPDTPVSHHDLFRIQRDHYEGTDFDLTKGLAGGAHGNPNRYDGGWMSGVPIEFLVEGNFERAISIHRTAYAIVTQSRAWLPNDVGATVWFGAAQPHATCFVPFYPAVTHISKSYQAGSLWKFRRESAWWAFAAVGNWMEKNYQWMSKDVKFAQQQREHALSDQRNGVETEAAQLIRSGRVLEGRAKLTLWSEQVAEQVQSDWWSLFEHLIAKYLNGAMIDNFHTDIFSPQPLFYPFEWLKQVGYWPDDMDFTVQGPRPVHVVPAAKSTPTDRPPAVAAPPKGEEKKVEEKAEENVKKQLADEKKEEKIREEQSKEMKHDIKEHRKEVERDNDGKHSNKDKKHAGHATSLAATVDTSAIDASALAPRSSSNVVTLLGGAALFAAGIMVGRLLQKRQEQSAYSALA